MTVDQLQQEIRAFCELNTNPELVQKYARYFVEGYDAYGVDGKLMGKQREIWLKTYAPLGLAGFLDLGDRLFASGKYEEGFLAIAFVRTFIDHFTPPTLDRLGNWAENGIRNWAHSDSFSMDLVSPFLTNRIVPLEGLDAWRSSPARWKRRSVPVSMLALLKTDLPIGELLAFLAPMMNDEEKVVQQGLGWFLREAWKLHPAEVEAYLLEWKETCGRTVVQYATEKMSADQKSRFRRSKN